MIVMKLVISRRHYFLRFTSWIDRWIASILCLLELVEKLINLLVFHLLVICE